jgi:hypothetical protein
MERRNEAEEVIGIPLASTRNREVHLHEALFSKLKSAEDIDQRFRDAFRQLEPAESSWLARRPIASEA